MLIASGAIATPTVLPHGAVVGAVWERGRAGESGEDGGVSRGPISRLFAIAINRTTSRAMQRMTLAIVGSKISGIGSGVEGLSGAMTGGTFRIGVAFGRALTRSA